jgi:hypothetical protein
MIDFILAAATPTPFLDTKEWVGLIVAIVGVVGWLGTLSGSIGIAHVLLKRNRNDIKSNSEDIGKLYDVVSLHDVKHAKSETQISNIQGRLGPQNI